MTSWIKGLTGGKYCYRLGLDKMKGIRKES